MGSILTKSFEYGQEQIDYLKKADSTLGAAITRLGRLERVIIPDLFAALVYAIVGQLISAKAVHTIWNKMQEQLGDITPQNIAKQTTEEIQRCGITMKKAACIHRIAHMIMEDKLNLDELHTLPDSEVIERLTSINGIGRWTAEMLLIHAMERLDIVSWGDIAIRRGMMKLYNQSTITKEQFEKYRLSYSPYGSIASIYLWELSME